MSFKFTKSRSEETKRFNALFSQACETGNVDLAEKMLKKGATNRNDLFVHACRDNNFTCVKTILSTVYDDDKTFDWPNGMKEACIAGHVDIVKCLEDNCHEFYSYDLYELFEIVGFGGNLEIIKLITRDGYRFGYMYAGLIGACRGGHKNVAIFMIEKGAKNWDQALFSACSAGQLEMAKLMIASGAKDVNEGLVQACEKCQTETIFYMIQCKADVISALVKMCKLVAKTLYDDPEHCFDPKQKYFQSIKLLYKPEHNTNPALQQINEIRFREFYILKFFEMGMSCEFFKLINNTNTTNMYHISSATSKIQEFRSCIQKQLHLPLLPELLEIVSLYSLV